MTSAVCARPGRDRRRRNRNAQVYGEPHLIAALEWTAKSNFTQRSASAFRQYSRIDHGSSTRSAILKDNVITAIEQFQTKGTSERNVQISVAGSKQLLYHIAYKASRA